MLSFICFTEDGTLPSSRKLLILINPFSGSGRSVKTFYDKVEPMLNEADIDFDAVTTGNLVHIINCTCHNLTRPFPISLAHLWLVFIVSNRFIIRDRWIPV